MSQQSQSVKSHEMIINCNTFKTMEDLHSSLTSVNCMVARNWMVLLLNEVAALGIDGTLPTLQSRKPKFLGMIWWWLTILVPNPGLHLSRFVDTNKWSSTSPYLSAWAESRWLGPRLLSCLGRSQRWLTRQHLTHTRANCASSFLETSSQELTRSPQSSLSFQSTLFLRLKNCKLAGLEALFLSMLNIR